MKLVLAMFASYLLGSFPTAFVFGKLLKGIDIRQHGSGNVGATNAIRVLGKGPGILVLVLDVLKGLIAVTLIGDYFGFQTVIERILLAVAVVCGHNWTIFLQFKGGKGIATSLGVLIGLTIKFPSLGPVLLVAILVWVAVFLVSGFVSLASMLAGLSLPVMMLLTHQSPAMLVLSIIFAVFVLVRHRPNIRRLIEKKEPKVPFPFQKKPS